MSRNTSHYKAVQFYKADPLLASLKRFGASSSVGTTTQDDLTETRKPEVTPLPYFELFIICLINMTEAMMFVQLTPYVPDMIQLLLEIDDQTDPRVSIYTGVLIACFPIAQFFFAPLWGRWSDRIGRRPVLLIGLLGNVISIPLFGFSVNIGMAIATRTLQGSLNGNIGVTKTYASEILDKTNQAYGFSILVFCYTVGMSIGPTVGGTLYGTHSTGIFGRFPYLLPCLASTSVSLIALVVGIFHLKETFDPHRVKARKKRILRAQQAQLLQQQDPEKPKSIYRILWENKVYVNATAMYLVNSVVMFSYSTLVPLWLRVDPQYVGWGWDTIRIGGVLAFQVVGTTVGQIILFPLISRHVGLLWIFRFGWIPCILLFFSFPLLLELPPSAQFGVFAAFQVVMSMSVGITYVIVNIVIPNSVYREILGAANGAAHGVVSGARAIAPLVLASIFGWSLDYELKGGWGSQTPFLNRNLTYYISALLGIFNVYLSFRIPKEYNNPKPPKLKSDYDQEQKLSQLRDEEIRLK